MDVFAFDIETIPDVATGRRLLGVHNLDDDGVARVMVRQNLEKYGTEFLRPHLHRIVAISVVLRSADRFKVWSLGDEQADEKELISRFYDGVDRYSPTLVSWNGGGFDLPVLHYRSLLHGVAAPRYWENGDDDNSFRYNNYLSRFHERHTDLMDVLAGYQPRSAAKLDEISVLIGLPGKLGMDGSKVWATWCRGEVRAIRNYCETDVLNTYLVYLRFQQLRGRLSDTAYASECDRVYQTLRSSELAHLSEFADAWDRAGRVPGEPEGP